VFKKIIIITGLFNEEKHNAELRKEAAYRQRCRLASLLTWQSVPASKWDAQGQV